MNVVDSDTAVIRIILVDENPIYAHALHLLLESSKNHFNIVATVPSVEECLQLIPIHQPDLVLLKYSDSSKRDSALDFIRACKEKFPIIPIVFYTSDSSIQTIFAAVSNGVACYLLHTSTDEELVGALHIAFSHGSVLSPLVAQKLISEISHPVAKRFAPSVRETEILELMATGRSNKTIAKQLFLSPRTVESHIHNLFEKMGVFSRTEAVLKAFKLGFISVNDTSDSLIS